MTIPNPALWEGADNGGGWAQRAEEQRHGEHEHCGHRSHGRGHDRRFGLPPTVAAHGDMVALRGTRPDDEWLEWTFAEYADHVARAAAGLRALGRRSRATASC